MPSTFSYDLSLADPPTKAQARLRESVTEEVLRSADMRPGTEAPDSLSFRPQWGWPLAAALTRRARGENINLEFRATDSGTTVVVTGKVAGRAEKVANREFWSETLTPA
jgi:hypothetical protein